MKYLILFALIALAVSNPMIGKCQGTPKLRPIECFKGQVLNEDLPELEELLAKYKDGDDHEFPDYLGDMFDKKDYREGRYVNEVEKDGLLGKCGMHPKYQPFGCFEAHVLRRNKKELKAAFETRESNFDAFISLYTKLVEAKLAYFGDK